MRALRRFTVRARLPEPLSPLAELVANLRWSWHPETRELFQAVDPALWDECRGDPVRLLGEVSPARTAELAGDRRFLRRLSDARDDLEDYLSAGRWYQSLPTEGPKAVPRSIAYLSMEYGITEVLPQYSGGLGILAGDHLKAASDLGVPIIGVGLLYHAGYFVQSLSRDGWQQERYPGLDPAGLPLTRLSDADGAPLRIEIALPEARTLYAHVWKAQVGRVPLLLLTTDIEDNSPEDRSVTDRLYGGGAEHRLTQEMLLGIGGVRALRAYCALTDTPDPEVFHANEGHAGFLGLERIRELLATGMDYDAALQAVRAGSVFTTHTPVPAGIDRFPRALVAATVVKGAFGEVTNLPAERVLDLGAEADPTVFNMAHMGLRLAARANGVSKLHGEVSRGMFADLWPGFDPADVPITSITNGVHAPTWVAPEVLSMSEREGRARLGFAAVDTVSDEVVWDMRRTLRAQLVTEVRRRTRASWVARGVTEAELGWTEQMFDPDVLTIGFARRVPSYKRLTLMLRDRDRLRRLLLDPTRPVQLVIAGKSHPADDGGKELIQQLVRFADGEDVRHRIVFLPDYDIAMARYLYIGCDVWLNNPLRPLEACGTSGMKAALNGCLNLSIRDGWWDEMYDGENGWAIPTADDANDAERRDDIESAGLYGLLEGSVVPRFYDRDPKSGIPRRWVSMVRHTLRTLGPKVLANRMVRDYVQQLYAPAAQHAQRLAAEDYAGARSLAAWITSVEQAWSGVSVSRVEADAGRTPALGAELDVRALVDLGGLEPHDVDVQVCSGRVDDTDRITSPTVSSLAPDGMGEDGLRRYQGTVALDQSGPFGYTVRVLPQNPLMAHEAALGLMTTA